MTTLAPGSSPPPGVPGPTIGPPASPSAPGWYARALERASLVAERTVFFVCGCQKSGTTWLQRLLDQHAEIRCDGEGHPGDILAPAVAMALDAADREPRLARKVGSEARAATMRFVIDQTLGRYVEEAEDPAAIRCVGDKTPESAARLELLVQLHPAARVIHVIRDGRDGTVSGWAHHGRAGTQDRFATFADYAELFARSFWVPYIRTARAVGAGLGGRYLEVRYEQLLADPRGETGRMLEHLGVDAGESSVDACVAGASFDRLSGGRRRGQADDASHWRKGVSGEWRTAFDADALERFERHAGDLMDELGYPRGLAD